MLSLFQVRTPTLLCTREVSDIAGYVHSRSWRLCMLQYQAPMWINVNGVVSNYEIKIGYL
jgi:hypothetical protein